MARGKLRETREPVGDPLDNAEPGRSRSSRREKSRQDRRGSFMAPVAKKAGEAHAEDRTIHPGLLFWSANHGSAVYSRKFSIQREMCSNSCKDEETCRGELITRMSFIS